MSRGNQGQSIFNDDGDRERYLNLLTESQKRFGYQLYAYVLMENHIHHLIEIGQTPLSKVCLTPLLTPLLNFLSKLQIFLCFY